MAYDLRGRMLSGGRRGGYAYESSRDSRSSRDALLERESRASRDVDEDYLEPQVLMAVAHPSGSLWHTYTRWLACGLCAVIALCLRGWWHSTSVQTTRPPLEFAPVSSPQTSPYLPPPSPLLLPPTIIIPTQTGVVSFGATNASQISRLRQPSGQVRTGAASLPLSDGQRIHEQWAQSSEFQAQDNNRGLPMQACGDDPPGNAGPAEGAGAACGRVARSIDVVVSMFDESFFGAVLVDTLCHELPRHVASTVWVYIKGSTAARAAVASNSMRSVPSCRHPKRDLEKALQVAPRQQVNSLRVEVVANLGRNDGSYLLHIVRHYEQLADLIIFTKDSILRTNHFGHLARLCDLAVALHAPLTTPSHRAAAIPVEHPAASLNCDPMASPNCDPMPSPCPHSRMRERGSAPVSLP